jgi:hypothetical protein
MFRNGNDLYKLDDDKPPDLKEVRQMKEAVRHRMDKGSLTLLTGQWFFVDYWNVNGCEIIIHDQNLQVVVTKKLRKK